MARWYSKRRKTKLSKVIKQGEWLKYCGEIWPDAQTHFCAQHHHQCYACYYDQFEQYT